MIRKIGFGLILLFIFEGMTGCAVHRHRTPRDLVDYGIRLAEKGYWHEAAIHWRIVLEADPGNVAALNNLAVAAEVEGYPEKAEQGFHQALKLRPDSRILKLNLGALSHREENESTRPQSDREYEPKKRKDSSYDSSMD